MIPIYKLEDPDYNVVILWDKDPNIGKVVYMEKELSTKEVEERLVKFFNEPIMWSN